MSKGFATKNLNHSSQLHPMAAVVFHARTLGKDTVSGITIMYAPSTVKYDCGSTGKKCLAEATASRLRAIFVWKQKGLKFISAIYAFVNCRKATSQTAGSIYPC